MYEQNSNKEENESVDNHAYADLNPIRQVEAELKLPSFIFQAILFSAILLLVIGYFFPQIYPIYSTNPWLNGSLIALTCVGIVYFFVRSIQLLNAENVLCSLAPDYDSENEVKSALLSDSFETFFSDVRNVTRDNAETLSNIMAERLIDLKTPLKYLSGFLLLLGLLGTFWGLLQTLGAAHHIIDAFAPTQDMTTENLVAFKQNLTTPFSNMSIAFSSSLFGLFGCLVIGFYEWRLSSMIRTLSFLTDDKLNERLQLVQQSTHSEVSHLNTSFPVPMVSASSGEVETHHDGLLYRKLFEISDRLDTLKNHFFVSRNDNKDDILLSHLEKTLVVYLNQMQSLVRQSSERGKEEGIVKYIEKSVLPYFHTIQSFLQHSSFTTSESNMISQFKDVIVPQLSDIQNSLSHIAKRDMDLTETLGLLTDNFNNISSENKKITENLVSETLILKDITHNIEDNMRHLGTEQINGNNTLSELKAFLSHELSKMKMDLSKPIMFMPVQEDSDINGYHFSKNNPSHDHI